MLSIGWRLCFCLRVGMRWVSDSIPQKIWAWLCTKERRKKLCAASPGKWSSQVRSRRYVLQKKRKSRFSKCQFGSFWSPEIISEWAMGCSRIVWTTFERFGSSDYAEKVKFHPENLTCTLELSDRRWPSVPTKHSRLVLVLCKFRKTFQRNVFTNPRFPPLVMLGKSKPGVYLRV